MEQGKKMVDISHSYNMNHSTISGTILRNKDKIMEHVKSAVPIMLTISKRGKSGDEETSQCVEAGSTSELSLSQINSC